MSSSEQAPEPTMDEILASIRKIISDDEPTDAAQPEVAAPVPEPPAPAQGGLTEDLTNALNDTQAGAAEADDILDLTQIVDEQPQQSAEPQTGAPQGDALNAALDSTAEAVAAPAPVSDPASAPQGGTQETGGDIDITSLLAEAGVQDIEPPAEPSAPAGDDLGAILGQGDEVAPKAGDAPISEALAAMNRQSSEPAAGTIPDAAMAESEPAVEPQPETSAPVEADLDSGVFTPEASQGAVAPDTPDIPEASEAATEAPLQEDASFEVAGETAAPAGEASVEDAAALAGGVDALQSAESSEPAEEQAPEEVAEAASVGDGGKTLEDSVKDLLRPMLREWLDDNMERIVQDEVASAHLKKQDS